MKKYYDRRRTLAPVFKPGDKVFLDASDIQTTRPSQKLSHRRLGPFIVERRIGPMAYHLKLPHWMKQLHLVFNVVKLTPAPDDPIPGRKTTDHPLPIIIDGEAEWEVEEILNSCWHRRRFQYLVKWKGYGREHNSWESTSEVSAPDSQRSSIANTLGLQDTSAMRNSTTFFILSPLLRDIAILKGG